MRWMHEPHIRAHVTSGTQSGNGCDEECRLEHNGRQETSKMYEGQPDKKRKWWQQQQQQKQWKTKMNRMVLHWMTFLIDLSCFCRFLFLSASLIGITPTATHTHTYPLHGAHDRERKKLSFSFCCSTISSVVKWTHHTRIFLLDPHRHTHTHRASAQIIFSNPVQTKANMRRESKVSCLFTISMSHFACEVKAMSPRIWAEKHIIHSCEMYSVCRRPTDLPCVARTILSTFSGGAGWGRGGGETFCCDKIGPGFDY